MLKLIRVTTISFVVFCLFVDNLKSWNVYGSTISPSQHFFSAINFHQNAWGMYSFDLIEVRSLRYKFDLTTGVTLERDSEYGHIPSFKRTLLGNLDPFVATNKELSNEVVKYLCKSQPLDLPASLAKVTLQIITRKVPRLHNADPNDGKIISVTDGASATCS